LTTTSGKKQPDEPPVFFLDRTFGRNELAELLRAEDFLIVTIFEEYGDKEHKIIDPVMIVDCGFKNRVLLTGDKDLVYTWAKEIIESNIAVFVTTDNNEGPKQWGPRIIAAKAGIMRELSRRKKPFTGRISREGCVTQVRVYENGSWKSIAIGKKNPAHVNKQKQKSDPDTY
jgi:hypothetical protein